MGEATVSYPEGRKAKSSGYPLQMAELLAHVSPESYISLISVHDVKHILKTKRAIKKAFEVQMQDLGFGLVEILASCPTNWKLNPVECNQKIAEKVMPFYPLGVFSDITKRD